MASESKRAMTSRARRVGAGTLLAIAGVSIALANPVMLPADPANPLGLVDPPVDPPVDPIEGARALALYFLLFPLEGLFIAMLAEKSSVYLPRFVLAWTGVSTVTFGALALLLAALVPAVGAWGAIAAGEAVVVAVETWCVVVLLRRMALVRNADAAPGFRMALACSLAANLLSFVGGAFVAAFAFSA